MKSPPPAAGQRKPSHDAPRLTIVFADGAAKRNPGPGGWGAVVISPDDRVSELGGGAPHTTNNRMELTAAIEALAFLRDVSGPARIYSDSSYVVHGMTRWIGAWKRRGWTTVGGSEVLNRDLWEELDRLATSRGRAHAVTWSHVRGHSGIAGNERADAIADSFASQRLPSLYEGPLSAYEVSVFPLPDEAPPSERRTRASSTKGRAPYSYLSLVEGKLMRHSTWAECEQRVKGRAGARFKKAMTAGEEAAILEDWGLTPDDLEPHRS